MFNLFKKKREFRITWSYGLPADYTYTEYMKGYDKADAWRRIVNQHGIAVNCIEIEELG